MKNKKLFAILTLLCFLFTLMPVAAFAAVNVQTSYAYTVKANPSVTVEDKVALTFAVRGESTTDLYVWFQEKGSDVPSNATAVYPAGEGEILASDLGNGILFIDNASTEAVTNVKFTRAGSYVLYAATVDPLTMKGDTIAEKIANSADYKLRTLASSSEVTVTSASVAYDDYRVNVSYSGDGEADGVDLYDGLTALANGKKATALKIDANAIDTATVTVKLYNKVSDQKILGGKTFTIATNSSNVTVDKTSATTNALGNIEFDVTGVAAGEYIIYLTSGGFDLQIPVKVGSTDAAYIETVKQPTAPLNVGISDLKGKVEFAITDINGNEKTDTLGEKAFTSNTNPDNKNYVKFVSQPEASKLVAEDLGLAYDSEKGYYIVTDKAFEAEGTYVIQVALDNGNSAKATIEIKEFTTPVELKLVYKQEAVELAGKAVVSDLVYVDANGVEKDATDAKLAASGYAITAFYPEAEGTIEKGTIYVSANEKYIGSEIKVTAVSERYNLIANATVKVTADAAELAFADKTAEVNVNNKINVQIVDAEGNKVAPTNVVKSEISYVVLDKPADAKVAVATVKATDLADKGVFTMSLTSDKVGNVTVQAVAKLTIKGEPATDGKTAVVDTTVVKYYTGTQIFAVGTEGVGDVVVMSIGSNEIVINDAKATIDAAPIVENNRTFVPFRALAEAFGATVAYDEATQAVTAELNGVTVVMTIGSAEYTVNGEAKTADVAPFINGSRTMVPVRFAAEAFGIKVIPTYDENGATADILFNL